MADVVPFKCWRPQPDTVAEVGAAPYDTFSRAEATAEIAAHPYSFLRIDKPAALFGDETGEYDACVYERASNELQAWYEQGILVPDTEPLMPAYYIYRLSKGSHSQIGVMACVSVADYQNGVIKRHENTRTDKEQDRVEHVLALEAHTGPILLTYPSLSQLDATLKEYVGATMPLFDFVAADGVRHEFWRLESESIAHYLQATFDTIPFLYIADGHHRAAAAAQVAKRYEAADASASSEAAYFLAALFGSDELQILDYNRVISDLAGMQPAQLLASISEVMEVEKTGSEPYQPAQRGEYGMYLEDNWYKVRVRESLRPDDAVEGQDVALLHSCILEPLLGISDPRSNPRISYVGGIRGLAELAKRADETGGVAFALYPCSVAELFAVADEDRLMPPKSTWFEPKLKSGLAIHRITD